MEDGLRPLATYVFRYTPASASTLIISSMLDSLAQLSLS